MTSPSTSPPEPSSPMPSPDDPLPMPAPGPAPSPVPNPTDPTAPPPAGPQPVQPPAPAVPGGASPFADRRSAGRALGAELAGRPQPAPAADVVVLGLPRGGVVVAAGVADALGAPLDVVPVRKLGLPGQPELAMGAIAAAGDVVETVRTEAVLARVAVAPEEFAAVRDRELTELRRREAAYRGDRPPVPLAGRTVVLVDDGLATGATMRAAVAAVRRAAPDRVVVAVPVGSPNTCAALRADVDDVVCLWAPAGFTAVGQGYDDFRPTGDDEVRAALATGPAAGR